MSPKVPNERSHVLRLARTRAIARLRAEYDARYQELMDEEISILGGEPRLGRMPYRPRNEDLLTRFNQQ
jgi:hypothetical protein